MSRPSSAVKPADNASISLGCALAKLLHFNILQLGGGYERTVGAGWLVQPTVTVLRRRLRATQVRLKHAAFCAW